MTPMPTTATRGPAPQPQGSYPFGAFALQATLGVRIPPTSSRERGGAAA